MKYFSHLNTATRIIKEYDGKLPFHIFLKEFFRKDKKYGSKDRRNITHLCYCCFRTGRSLLNLPIEERIIAGLFLCSAQPNELLENLAPDWNKEAGSTEEFKWSLIGNKSNLLHHSFSLTDTLFPVAETEFSDELNKKEFLLSHLTQPDLFIRIRPGNYERVMSGLSASGIAHEFIAPHTVRIPNGTKIEELFEADKEIIIQDYSSQNVYRFMEYAGKGSDRPVKIWDCCTGSGGKSILAYDLLPDSDITVSDVRGTILQNLRKRFEKAGIKKYRSFILDLSLPPSDILVPPADLLIADVPCTGSGTWSRTPEQLVYFNQEEINRYNELQKKIVSHAIPHLSKTGYFLYITCSVFKKENEDMVSFIEENSGLRMIKKELLKGYDRKADTLFAALFQR